MKAKHLLIVIPAGVLALALLLLFVEMAGAVPHYEMEKAVVRAVVPNPPWHYIAQKEMTLIRFADGYTTDIGGNRGAPGETILAPRQRGVDTPFGWLAHR